MNLGLMLISTALALQPTLSRKQLFDSSTLVVEAEVTSSEVRWAANSDGHIETVVWLTPLNTLRGKTPSTIELVLRGGKIGDYGTWVEDVPKLQLDERYLLYLRDDPVAGLQIVGGEQGAVHVR